MQSQRIRQTRTAFELLRYWIIERDRIREAKDSGAPRPWTTDPILATWRFCNVDRCDDRETRWIFSNIIEPHQGWPLLWFNLAIARFINWSPTLAAIGFYTGGPAKTCWNREHFVATMERRLAAGEKVYTGAYMIPAGPAGVVKHVFLADSVFTPLWERRHKTPPWRGQSCAAWSEFFAQTRCMGAFLRNQIITDMRYSYHLADACDWSTFVLAGPGTQRGLNRIHGRKLSLTWTEAEASNALLDLRQRLFAIDRAHPFAALQDLNNLANCLCEFDKYCRVLHGEGFPRARYTPASSR